MVRTQIYLTEKERDSLAALSGTSGRSQSDLIREAVDRLIEDSSTSRHEMILESAAGMWRNRTDLPDFKVMRAEWERESKS